MKQAIPAAQYIVDGKPPVKLEGLVEGNTWYPVTTLAMTYPPAWILVCCASAL